MKKILLLAITMFSIGTVGQSTWHTIGPDDFNQASYGITNSGNDEIRNNRLSVRNGIAYAMNIEIGIEKSRYVMSKFTGGKWEHVETPFWISDNTDSFAFEVDGNEVPYLFLNDPTNDNRASVKKFNGTSWVNLCGEPVSMTSSTILEMSVGNDNLPVVMFKDAGALQVKKFDGTDWVSLPVSDLEGLTTGLLKVDQNNVQHVLYSYYSGGYFSFVKKFNGSNWDEDGISDFPGYAAAIALDSSGMPCIVTNTTFRKYNGSAWEILPAPPSVNGAISLAYDADDHLYACYRTNNLLDKGIYKLVDGVWQQLTATSSYGPMLMSLHNDLVYELHTKSTGMPVVRKKNSENWEMLGHETAMLDSHTFSLNDSRKYQDLAIRDGLPLLSFRNTTGKLAVAEFNGAYWDNAGNALTSEALISNSKVEVDSDGNAYVAYLNLTGTGNDTQSKMTVKKLVGDNWELIGPLNFSLDAETKMDLKINSQNVPYVVYKSGRVQKFNGTSWEFVGGSAFTGDKNVELCFDNADQPYLIHSGVVVKRFNGNNWEEIGAGSFTEFPSAELPQIAVDGNNNIVIAFLDTAKKINVFTWNGSNWLPLGNPISTGTTPGLTFMHQNFLALEIDYSNTPYVYFNSRVNDFRDMANVYKFNGNAWEPVGMPDFSSGHVRAGGLAFTESNIPVVTYSAPNGIYSKFFGTDGQTLSVTDAVVSDAGIKIAPNPVHNIFTVEVDETIKFVAIFDSTGKKVLSSTDAEIDVSALQRGLYIVQIETTHSVYSKKILKE